MTIPEYELVVVTEAEVTRYPDCPACGETDCTICHITPEETP